MWIRKTPREAVEPRLPRAARRVITRDRFWGDRLAEAETSRERAAVRYDQLRGMADARSRVDALLLRDAVLMNAAEAPIRPQRSAWDNLRSVIAKLPADQQEACWDQVESDLQDEVDRIEDRRVTA